MFIIWRRLTNCHATQSERWPKSDNVRLSMLFFVKYVKVSLIVGCGDVWNLTGPHQVLIVVQLFWSRAGCCGCFWLFLFGLSSPGSTAYLLVAHRTGQAGAGARDPRLGDPLALQLGGVGGDHSLGHKQVWRQAAVGGWPDDCVTLQTGNDSMTHNPAWQAD